MRVERDILQQLESWKDSPYRKPLLLKGARQVGKTWALKEFGRTRYRNVAYFSLENITPTRPSEYAQFFELTKDPHRIRENLALASGQPINPGETLIILDEIQDCPAAIGSLKYFYEDAPEFHLACAGSLLGVALREQGSFPVGKVDFMDMYPLTFSEYLRATGNENLDTYCKQIASFEVVPDIFAHSLEEKLRAFFITGGMPESVLRWIETGDVELVQKVLADLLDSYQQDFAKHGGAAQYAKISLVWASLPLQLSRENKKFMYGLVKEGARAREYEEAIQWLSKAGLLYKIFRSTGPGIPITAYDIPNAFKIYSLDVGLLRRMSHLDPHAFAEGGRLFSEFKGALTENYLLQSLVPQLETMPRYWACDKPPHEVDFLIQAGNHIIPLEVKSGRSITSTSLKYYGTHYPEQTPLRVRFSLKNLALDGNLLNIPLWLADESARLVALALKAGSERSLNPCESKSI